jgi:hypothetical protein
MKIIVDGKDERETAPGGAGLGEVYAEVATRLYDGGRTVVGLSIDGRDLTDEEQDKLLAGEDVGGSTLELRTMETRTLACETLSEVEKHCLVLREAIEMTVKLLGRGERPKALEEFKPALELWVAVFEAVIRTCTLVRVDNHEDLGGDTLGAGYARMVKVLNEVQTSLRGQDWVKLADVLEYEVLPVLDQWQKLVGAIRARLQGQRQA